MTLQEAIKTGKPFRRPFWAAGAFIEVSHNSQRMAWLGGDFIGQGWFHPTPDDIFADDWSTEDQRLNLSRQQILDAINYHYPRLMELQLVKEEFFKTLGFRN